MTLASLAIRHVKKIGLCRTAFVLPILCAASVVAASGQTFANIANFKGPNGGFPSYMAPVQGRDGDIYGTTAGFSTDNGTVFRVRPPDVFRNLRITPEGIPNAGLILGADGDLYGTTAAGGGIGPCYLGCGTVFKISAGSVLTVLHRFAGYPSDGAIPDAVLIQAADGNFYGTTSEGGNTQCQDQAGCGTIFKMTPRGQVVILHNFTRADGASPYAGLVQTADGTFYGTTAQGGSHKICVPLGCGTVFKMTAKGVLTTLHNFNFSDGSYPISGLVQSADGDFYGVTAGGGSSGNGTFFRITSGGTLTTLHNFDLADGSSPTGSLILATDGSFYGTTQYGGKAPCPLGCGTVFRVTPCGDVTTLHYFVATDGELPEGGLLQATDGSFYGSTFWGGDLSCNLGAGCGTVFSISLGLPRFVALVRTAGEARQQFGILGQGFIGASTVLLNGTPARFSVRSATLILATVPPGATTGHVTVITPSGTLSSNVPFHVTQSLGARRRPVPND